MQNILVYLSELGGWPIYNFRFVDCVVLVGASEREQQQLIEIGPREQEEDMKCD